MTFDADWLFVPAGYLAGSFPTAYLLGRLRGVDLRRVGSGNLGGSNAAEFVGAWAFLVVGGIDVGKAALITLLARYWSGDLAIAALTGLAAIAGHNWSLYLRFKGGRGVSATLGALLVLFPLGWIVLLLPGLVLHPIRRDALGTVLGYLLLPLAAWLLGQPPPIVLACAGMAALAAAKRLLANGEPIPPGRRGQVLRNRVLHDRDVGPDEPWVERTRTNAKS